MINIKEIPVKRLPISVLQLNEGQIPDVPRNPRQISEERLEALKSSIEQLPDMLAMRELLVYPLGEHYVTLGGNQRLIVCKELGFEEIPCKILPEETTAETLRRIVMLDNEEFGKTDWDAVLENWNVEELTSWGVDTKELHAQDWTDLPFIEEEQEDPVLDKPVKIIVEVPFDLKQEKDAIKQLIVEAVSVYENIVVS